MSTRHADGKEVRAFLGRFQELYAEHRNGAKYFIRRPKDPVLVKALLEECEPADLEQMAVELLTVKDDWIAGTDRGIGILTVKASWLHSRIVARREREAGEDWYEECQRLHAGACGLSQDRHYTRKLLDAAREPA